MAEHDINNRVGLENSKGKRLQKTAAIPVLERLGEPAVEPDILTAIEGGLTREPAFNRHAALLAGARTDTQRANLAIHLQQTYGNRYVQRLVEYNEDVEGGRFTDPEQAKGVLPFTKDGWDGKEIARKLSQLANPVSNTERVRCVQTSFLVALVQRGPGALRDMIENYLNRYRVGLHQATTPVRIKRWYKRSIRNLKPLLAKIDSKTLTYEDLSTILREMYDVYGKGLLYTEWLGPKSAEVSMFEREGYTSVEINKVNVTQEDAATEAKNLKEGEFLACGVHVSKTGYEPAGHRVHLGRHPDGALYFYDPWPVKGDQMIVLSEDLKEIHHYFVNPLSLPLILPFLAPFFIGLKIEVPRTFYLHRKVSPPKEEEEAG